MTGRIALFTPGLLRLKDEIHTLSGFEPQFRVLSATGCDAVAGWGNKPTARRARKAAARTGIPYLAFEDGFLRSLKPGPVQKPASMIMDRTGIYYDASRPSDLETILQTAEFEPQELSIAHEIIAAIASHRLSKYNHGADTLEGAQIPKGKPIVLVIDQTLGDASIEGSLADAATFKAMAEAALRDNPDATVIAKLHPETHSGAKSGYIGETARSLGLIILARHLSPWCLLDLKPHVYTVSSQFGFEALLAGCKVTCYGLPFYAGWGLTQDRLSSPRRTRQRNAGEMAAAAYLRYASYFDIWLRKPVDVLTAIDQLAFLRRSYVSNSRPVVGYRIARWKRRAITAMLDGPAGSPRFTSNLRKATAAAQREGAAIAAWGVEAIRLRKKLEPQGIDVITIEDGFLRSVGLGAAFVQPLSLVFDRSGLYYDGTRPSDIEKILATENISPDSLARARKLRQQIVEARITKYNVGEPLSALADIPADRPVVLVPGQVADDWAVRIGRPPDFPPDRNVNDMLLHKARAAHPGAFVIFKPHPDVEHLGRAGALVGDAVNRHADFVSHGTSLENLLSLATHVETYSSLAGFEALLRGIGVSVNGTPFYAGWGLTNDRATMPRRGRKRSLDELVAVALIRYPRYWDPVSNLVCTPETVLQRIAARRSQPARWRGAGMLIGRAVIGARHIVRIVRGSEDGA